MRNRVNYIDKLDFLIVYNRARIEAITPAIIRSSFAATRLVPFNLDRVLLELNIQICTPTLLLAILPLL